MPKKKNTPIRNLRFLQRRHQQSGFDCDYLNKLSEQDQIFMLEFARTYYDGEKGKNPDHAREANHRKYMAKRADAMSIADSVEDAGAVDDLDPEKLLLLQEQVQKGKSPRTRKK